MGGHNIARRILITDNYCSYNQGDSAILDSMIFALKKLNPNAKFTVLSHFPEVARKRNHVTAYNPIIRSETPIVYLTILQILLSAIVLRISKKEKIWFLKPSIKEIMQVYVQADIVISCGGGFINDFYKRDLNGRLFGFLIAKILGKPVMLFAQSIGPFNTKKYRLLSKFVLNRVDLITLRDSISKKILDDLDVRKPVIYVTRDIAFTFPAITNNDVKNVVKQESLDKLSGPLFGFSVRQWKHVKFGTPDQMYEHYKKVISKVADELIKRYNGNIIFIPMALGEGGYGHDDRRVAAEIINLMKYKKQARIIEKAYSPSEIKSIISSMDLFIGTRMHSLIFAISTGVPIVAIEYEFKTRGLMQELQLENLLLTYEDINSKELLKKIKYAIDHQKQISNILEKNTKKFKAQAMVNAKLATKLILQQGIR